MTRFGDSSGICWTTCKQSAPHSRQITTPTPHQSMFTGRMLFMMPNQQSTQQIVNMSQNKDHHRRQLLLPGQSHHMQQCQISDAPGVSR